jgi:hypothetical protein
MLCGRNVASAHVLEQNSIFPCAFWCLCLEHIAIFVSKIDNGRTEDMSWRLTSDDAEDMKPLAVNLPGTCLIQ